MATKLPAFMFYPGDWRKDPDLSRCSWGAKGLLADLLCLMHENHHRGVLCERDGKTPWSNGDIATAVGGNADQFATYLCELEMKNVLKRNDDKCLYSSRMVKDEQIRKERAAAGQLGGKAKRVAKAKQKSSKPHSKREANAKQNTEYEYVNEDESVNKKDKPPRERNELWDSLVAEFWKDGVPASEKKRVGRLVRSLSEMLATGQEVALRRKYYATHFPDCVCTPEALVKHWSLCREPKPLPRTSSPIPADKRGLWDEELAEKRKLMASTAWARIGEHDREAIAGRVRELEREIA